MRYYYYYYVRPEVRFKTVSRPPKQKLLAQMRRAVCQRSASFQDNLGKQVPE